MAVAAELLRALPKVELHCHIEGTMRPETVMDLARRNHVRLPASDVRDLYRYRSLDEFLSVFWLVQSVLVNRDDWARLAYESVVDAAAAGRVYAEVFVTPARHLAAGQSLREVLAGLDDGLAAGDAETGGKARGTPARAKNGGRSRSPPEPRDRQDRELIDGTDVTTR